jgi:hypothetical protein
MSFLRQLFEITTRKNSMVQKLAKPRHKNIVTIGDEEYEKESQKIIFLTTLSYIMTSKSFLECQ